MACLPRALAWSKRLFMLPHDVGAVYESAVGAACGEKRAAVCVRRHQFVGRVAMADFTAGAEAERRGFGRSFAYPLLDSCFAHASENLARNGDNA